jgi:hypothetical protein
MLNPENPLIFNRGIVSQEKDNLVLRQKQQGKKLKLVDYNNPDFKQQYVEQRARGAYIATICQPEVLFDLLVVA